jgi:hypothetical protein
MDNKNSGLKEDSRLIVIHLDGRVVVTFTTGVIEYDHHCCQPDWLRELVEKHQRNMRGFDND